MAFAVKVTKDERTPATQNNARRIRDERWWLRLL